MCWNYGTASLAKAGVSVMFLEGSTRIEPKVLEKIAAAAVRSVPGTIDCDAKLGGIAGRAFPRFHIQVDNEHNLASVDAFIAVGWPAPAAAVAGAVRVAIAQAFETFAGYATSRVNVEIGQSRPSVRTHRADIATTPRPLAWAPRTPTPISLKTPQTQAQWAPREPRVLEPHPLKPIRVPQPRPLKPVRVLSQEPLHRPTIVPLFPARQGYNSIERSSNGTNQ